MDDMEALHWPRIGLLPVVHAIEAALREKRGFSLIRLGDGEGAVLSHDQPEMAAEVDFCCSVWFGDQVVDGEDVALIAARLEDAIRGADVLGLPRPAQLAYTARYGAVFGPLVRLRGGAVPQICDAAMHFYLQWSGALGRIMRLAERVTLIGCRDVASEVSVFLGIEASTWLIRGEAAFPGAVEEEHWPAGFRQICARIVQLEGGDLVLVGAGVLGKFYCEAAKQRGAVAIDIGSVFDGWVGVPSRGERTAVSPENSMSHLAAFDRDDIALIQTIKRKLSTTNIDDGIV